MQVRDGISQVVAERFPGTASVLTFFDERYECYVRQTIDGLPQVAVCLETSELPTSLQRVLRQHRFARLPLEVEVLLHPRPEGGWRLVISTARRYNVIYQVDEPGDLFQCDAPESQTLLTYLN